MDQEHQGEGSGRFQGRTSADEAFIGRSRLRVVVARVEPDAAIEFDEMISRYRRAGGEVKSNRRKRLMAEHPELRAKYEAVARRVRLSIIDAAACEQEFWSMLIQDSRS